MLSVPTDVLAHTIELCGVDPEIGDIECGSASSQLFKVSLCGAVHEDDFEVKMCFWPEVMFHVQWRVCRAMTHVSRHTRAAAIEWQRSVREAWITLQRHTDPFPLLSRLTNVSYLDVSNCGYPEFHKMYDSYDAITMPNLVSLVLRNTSTELSYLAQKCPNLKYVELRHTFVRQGDLTTLGMVCPHVEHIDLSSSVGYWDVYGTGSSALGMFPNLRYLDLSFSSVSDVGLKSVGCNCCKLVHVELSMTNVNDEGVCALASGCARLAYLGLKYTNVTDASVEALLQCVVLGHLDISYCTGITAQGIVMLTLLHSLVRVGLHGFEETGMQLFKIVRPHVCIM